MVVEVVVGVASRDHVTSPTLHKHGFHGSVDQSIPHKILVKYTDYVDFAINIG